MDVIEITPARAAIVDAVCLMVVIDEVLDPEEYSFLTVMLMTMFELDEDVSVALLENSLGRLDGAEAETFIEAVIDRIGTDDEKFALLVGLYMASMADGKVLQAELGLLEHFILRLKMAEAQVRAAEVQAVNLYTQATTVYEA
ncbi:MAG: hypothetical protein AAFS10_05475 [Myxococcota bacterium]